MRTDYINLRYFIITKELSRRQVRWAEILNIYDFIIKYIFNKNNLINTLSHRPNYIYREEELTIFLIL